MTGSRPARGPRRAPAPTSGTPRRGATRTAAGSGTALEQRIAELEARLRSMESRRPSMMGPLHFMMELLPPEAARHFGNAGREQLLGFKALVDHWLRRIEEERRAPDREEISID